MHTYPVVVPGVSFPNARHKGPFLFFFLLSPCTLRHRDVFLFRGRPIVFNNIRPREEAINYASPDVYTRKREFIAGRSITAPPDRTPPGALFAIKERFSSNNSW